MKAFIVLLGLYGALQSRRRMFGLDGLLGGGGLLLALRSRRRFGGRRMAIGLLGGGSLGHLPLLDLSSCRLFVNGKTIIAVLGHAAAGGSRLLYLHSSGGNRR